MTQLPETDFARSFNKAVECPKTLTVFSEQVANDLV
jgi:hypothetical protein